MSVTEFVRSNQSFQRIDCILSLLADEVGTLLFVSTIDAGEEEVKCARYRVSAVLCSLLIVADMDCGDEQTELREFLQDFLEGTSVEVPSIRKI